MWLIYCKRLEFMVYTFIFAFWEINFFWLLRASKASEALKKGRNFEFLTFKYILKNLWVDLFVNIFLYLGWMVAPRFMNVEIWWTIFKKTQIFSSFCCLPELVVWALIWLRPILWYFMIVIGILLSINKLWIVRIGNKYTTLICQTRFKSKPRLQPKTLYVHTSLV